ncbi:MAG: branched-chain amino acid ABC transporter permease [Candidatus Rokubacteria bacterium]|nr:branched-chain amino acid ABC transporter permease [Candidatus Rokubacteria bacterium]MBI2553231.1 branched-chain amino acid ABC transporter permease [Candidatus Rokubacteria bacterium]
MEFYFALATLFGFRILLGLSAYVVILTGQISMAQAGFYALGAYTAGAATALWGWPIVPAVLLGAIVGAVFGFLVGFPALRVRGLFLVIATLAFTEIVRMVFLNLKYTIRVGDRTIGPAAAEGFRGITYYFENGWSSLQIAGFTWLFVLAVLLAFWLMDRSRAGVVLRAVGEDELAASSVGINLTAAKVSAMTLGGLVAGLAGALYAHYATYLSQEEFGVLLASFAVAYPLIGGTGSVLGPIAGVLFFSLLIDGLRFLGDWRNLLFGVLIVAMMNVRPHGIIDVRLVRRLAALLRPAPKRAYAGD